MGSARLLDRARTSSKWYSRLARTTREMEPLIVMHGDVLRKPILQFRANALRLALDQRDHSGCVGVVTAPRQRP
jgi:hypothetical protein